ncbi:MAG TPA: hypothetical protein VN901_12200 [Candidatus Acidoferrales bacterium]|nr:hypothetical protein [Candidatus Acidoferrales bacterium]
MSQGRAELVSMMARGYAIGFRGTDPVVRVYSEARSEQCLEKLSTAAKQWIFE